MTRARAAAAWVAALVLWAGALKTGLGQGAPDPSRLLRVEALLERRGASDGALLLTARLASGWHVNSHRPSEDYLIATSVKLEPSPGVRFGDPRYPVGKPKKFAFAEKPLSVYENSFSIEVPVAWSGDRVPALSGSIEYQACSDKQCLAPASASFRAETSSTGSAALSGGAMALSGGGAAAAGASRDFGQLLERRGFPFVLLLLFLGGLALNLTPCVYPVIPLTIGFFGGQAREEGRSLFGLASLYVLGMATMYSALGVAAALSGRLFGSALQSPFVLAAVAAILVGLALSMFGLYDIRMPGFLMQKAGARVGPGGAYGMGLLVGVVAAPCVGPFVLGLLAFVAARQSAPLGFLLFLTLSLGLGLPYLFLAAFSGSLSRLPRAGEWMDSVKAVFGWVLLAMAAYFLRTVIPAPAGQWLLPAVLLVGAATTAFQARGRLRGLRIAAAALFFAAAIFFAPRLPAEASPAWRPYSAGEVTRASRSAVIDFSASWCAPCLELDKKTFSDPRVRESLERRALFKADLTKAGSAEAVALSQKYAILGVPTVIFLDAAGRERSELRLVGFEDADAFLKRLEKAP